MTRAAAYRFELQSWYREVVVFGELPLDSIENFGGIGRLIALRVSQGLR